jgi:hypothetical protein
MLERQCNGKAVSQQLAMAVEALDLADHWAGRLRPLRGWRHFEMDNNVIELKVGGSAPRPSTEPSPEPATVLEFRKKVAPAPAVAVAPTAEGEPLCPHCAILDAIEATVTSAVAIGVDPEEILERVFATLDELGCLPPPPVAGSSA